MNRVVSIRSQSSRFVLTLLCCLSTAVSEASAAERVALVVGNGDYVAARRLPNPTRDAAAVATLLEAQGFEVIQVKDAGIEAMYVGLEKFKKEAAGAEIGLFYYAGHGIEVDRRNYLLPVDAELDSSAQLRTQAIAVATVLGDMKTARIPAKLVILDCCRDNPLSRSWLATRSSQQGGLSQIDDQSIPPATMIMFASAPGQVALDGTGENSPFTSALLEQLAKPGQSAFDAFLGVSDAVAKTTRERQIPWIMFDGAGRTFRLFSLGNAEIGPSSPVASLPVMPPAKPEPGPEPEGISRGFTNNLGMKLVPVEGTDVLFCEHETRVQDYAAYAAENQDIDMSWKDVEWEGHGQGPDHPVVNVSWEDAKAFCDWLSEKEGRTYRLPTDHEWSVAVGIGDRESATISPMEKDDKIKGIYPWGEDWPPPSGSGNFLGQESGRSNALEEYSDSHVFTAPVKSYRSSRMGLYDLGGNVWEMCEELYMSDLVGKKFSITRGNCSVSGKGGALFSSDRGGGGVTQGSLFIGFRVVVNVGG